MIWVWSCGCSRRAVGYMRINSGDALTLVTPDVVSFSNEDCAMFGCQILPGSWFQKTQNLDPKVPVLP